MLKLDRGHFEFGMDPGLVVVRDGLVDSFDESTQRIKAVKLQSRICLEVVVEGFLITVLPRAALPAQGYPDAQASAGAGYTLLRCTRLPGQCGRLGKSSPRF